jgi:hypothetical protein
MSEEDLRFRIEKVKTTSYPLPDQKKQQVSETLEALVAQVVGLKQAGEKSLPKELTDFTSWLSTERGHWRAANTITRAFADFMLTDP